MTQPQPPAGFYPDPSGAPQQRFWNGTAWTPHTQPFAPPPVAPAPTAPTGYGTGPMPTSYGTGPVQTGYGTGPVPTDVGTGPAPTPADALGSIVGGLLTAVTDQAARTRTATPDRGVRGASEDFYRDHQRGVDTAAGGALVAEGLLGLDGLGGARRPGILGALKGVGFGLLFAAIALGIALFTTPREIPNAVSATGTVTEVTTSSSSSGSRTCGIRAEYVVDGTTYTVGTGYSSSSLCSTSRGSLVDVRYDPADPANSEIPESVGMRLIPWGLFGLGILITVVSAVRVVMRAAALGTGGWLLWRGLRGARSQA